jgi:hypothetical protein
MSHSRKRPRRSAAAAAGASGKDDGAGEVCDNSRGIDALDDMLPNILSYLRSREIMCTRRVNNTWADAVSKTAVSLEETFVVDSVKALEGLRVMSTVLPNLQSVRITPLSFNGVYHKYNVGEEPEEEQDARTDTWRTHDIEIITGFTKLRRLELLNAPLNGRYPFLFNFPLIQKLSISNSACLKWDLGMLARLPMLKELECCTNSKLTGNISSLRVLKDTLEKVTLAGCFNVEGNFMDLADFPRLTKLYLSTTAVTTDIQDIGNEDFSTMEDLFFGINKSVSGNIRSLRVLKDTLRELTLEACPNVEGNFMALSDFPHLRSLHLDDTAVVIDIEDISNGDFARLEELGCVSSLGRNMGLASGNIRNLRVLKDTLTNVTITNCLNVEGNIMDLADFPRLRTLDLEDTAVTGDIRDIGADDFSKLEELVLPSTMYGGYGCELQRISDAPELMRALYQIKKHHPSLILDEWYGCLSQDSPDWYDWGEEINEDCASPPFWISLVETRTRIGYQWKEIHGVEHCEVNWLDPVPTEESSDYEEFLVDLQQIENQVDFYKGYHQPPTQEEYNRLVEEERRLER